MGVGVGAEPELTTRPELVNKMLHTGWLGFWPSLSRMRIIPEFLITFRNRKMLYGLLMGFLLYKLDTYTFNLFAFYQLFSTMHSTVP